MVEDHGDGRGGDGQRIAVGRGDPVTTPRGAEQIFSLRVLIGTLSKREAGAASA